MGEITQEELRQLLGFRPVLDITPKRVLGASVAYVRWVPLTGLDEMLRAFAKHGASYEERSLLRRTKDAEAELYCRSGTWGEYRWGLFVAKGRTHLFRRFPRKASHYITQHGFDGLPRPLGEAWMNVRWAGVPIIECQQDSEVIARVSLRWWFDYFTYGWLRVHDRPMDEVVSIWAGMIEGGVPPDAWLEGGRGLEKSGKEKQKW